MEIKNEDLFYCYSKKLSDFIYHNSGIVPLTVAKNMKSGTIFSLYGKSEALQSCLDAYKERNK